MTRHQQHQKPLRIAVVVGEHSGDALGGKLIATLKEQTERDIVFVGVGGDDMAREGFQTEFPISDVAVMGPVAILKRMPLLVRRVYQTVDAVLQADPDVVVVIDSPEFTHPIAKRIKKKRPDIPVIDYVCPSVWAWRQGRARKMRTYIDHVLALLPFEPTALDQLNGPPGTYVGHPLADRLTKLRELDPTPLRERLNLANERPTLVVLPGSRASEVSRLIEPFGQAIGSLQNDGVGANVIIPVVDGVRHLVEEQVQGWSVKPHLVTGTENKFAAFRLADVALAASGTVTLELAVVGTPMVVAYKVEPLATVLRYLLKVHSVVLPNLMLGRNAFPEFLQEDCTPENLAAAIKELVDPHSNARAAQIEALSEIPKVLDTGGKSPSTTAATVVLDYAERRRLTTSR